MTIDERLEKLTERHESLAQSVELLVLEGRETDRRVKETVTSLQSLAVEGRETDRRLKEIGTRIDGLTAIVMQLVTGTASLLRTAEAHERRISGLEAGD